MVGPQKTLVAAFIEALDASEIRISDSDKEKVLAALKQFQTGEYADVNITLPNAKKFLPLLQKNIEENGLAFKVELKGNKIRIIAVEPEAVVEPCVDPNEQKVSDALVSVLRKAGIGINESMAAWVVEARSAIFDILTGDNKKDQRTDDCTLSFEGFGRKKTAEIATVLKQELAKLDFTKYPIEVRVAGAEATLKVKRPSLPKVQQINFE